MRSFVLSLVLALFSISPVLAQESPPALVVTLRDVAGMGVPGIAIIVTDRSGITVLARGTTGADGAVSFAALPVSEVRVQVSGQLPDGVSLRLPGQDAEGIAVTLGVPAVQLDLRSEADGMVRPDPASITLEPGVPLTEPAFPTARPAVTLAPTIPTLLTTVPDVSVAPESTGSSWAGLILLALLLLGVLGVLVLQMRGRPS